MLIQDHPSHISELHNQPVPVTRRDNFESDGLEVQESKRTYFLRIFQMPVYDRMVACAAEAKVLGVVEDVKHGHGVIFDRTIFHPQGGGQPSDEGL